VPLIDELRKMKDVQVIKGKIQAIFGFGNQCSGLETVECNDIKIMKAETYVLCSNSLFLKQMIDLKLYAPVLRIPTDLIARYLPKVNEGLSEKLDETLSKRATLLRQLNGPVSVLTLDTLPVVGRSSRYLNMFYFTGFSSTNVEFRKQMARLLAEQVIQHECASQSSSDLDKAPKVSEFSPKRFKI
jgi:hypothetical protein